MADSIQAIVMPRLGLSMTEGMVAKWHVEPGARVTSGDVIADIETSKITNELQAHSAGVIRGSLAEAGVDLPVGSLLCVLADNGASEEEIAAFISAFAPLDSGSMEVTGEIEDATPAARSNPASEQQPDAGQMRATPVARRLAAQSGINLAEVTPTGPRGRVSKADVEKAIAAAKLPEPSPPAAQSAAAGSTGAEYEEIPLTPMRRTIAKRLAESKQAAPHFRLTVEANMGRMLSLRADLAHSMENVSVSINDLLIKAAAAALIKAPAVNIQFDGEMIRRYANAHVAVAVAVEEGLLTPIIRDANRKSIMEISLEMRELSRRARSGTLQPDEFEGGTFTLSNLGMFGIQAFDAIINPPQAAILAVGAICKRRIPADGGDRTAAMMTATLSCDHRVVDGVTGARFMQALQEFLEHPHRLLI